MKHEKGRALTQQPLSSHNEVSSPSTERRTVIAPGFERQSRCCRLDRELQGQERTEASLASTTLGRLLMNAGIPGIPFTKMNLIQSSIVIFWDALSGPLIALRGTSGLPAPHGAHVHVNASFETTSQTANGLNVP